MTESKIYQVVYCFKRNRVGERRGGPHWLQEWFLLKCPVVGIGSVAEARRLIKEQKQELGPKASRFQPVIIGETNGDFEGMDCDSLFGVHAIGCRDAREEEFPDMLLDNETEEDGQNYVPTMLRDKKYAK
jgi:hypothetical protein